MKAIITIIILSFTAIGNLNAVSYTWTGNTSTAWNNAGNWSPNTGFPTGAADNVTIVSATNMPVLDQNRTINALTVTSGTLDFNTFTLQCNGNVNANGGTLTNGLLKPRGTQGNFAGTYMDVTVDAFCGLIKLNGGTFTKVCRFEDTSALNSAGDGGCTFNDSLYIIHTGTGGKFFKMAQTTGNTYNGPVVLTNTSDEDIWMSVAGSNSYNDNIIVNNTGTKGITFGINGGTSTLASGKTISVGSSGFTADLLSLNNFTQSGSTSQTLTLTGTATMVITSSTFNGGLSVTAPGFLLKNSVFNGVSSFTKNGTSNYHSYGGNTFNNNLTISNTGAAGRIRLATTSADTYMGETIFETSGEDIQVAYSGVNSFYGAIETVHTGIVFNAGTGTCKLTGSSIIVLDGDFPFYNLTIDMSPLPQYQVNLNGSASVDGTLNLIQGKLNVSSLLTMNAGSSVTNASNASFVSGPVQKIGNTSFVFPIGKDRYFGSIHISSPSSISAAFTAEYFHNNQNISSNIDSTLLYLSTQNYWSLTRDSGSDSVTVTFKWDRHLFGYGFDSTRLKIAFYNGTKWDPISSGSLISANNHLSIPTASSISNFGYFIIANAGAGGFNSGIVTYNRKAQIWGGASLHQHGNCSASGISATTVLHNPTSLDGTTYCTGITTHLLDVVEIDVGRQSFARLCDNTLVGWGLNENRQIGNPEASINSLPWLCPAGVPVLTGSTTSSQILSNITAVASGYYGTIALTEDGTIYEWGAAISEIASSTNVPGLATGSTIPIPVTYGPPNYDIVEDIIAIAAGGFHFIALKRDGNVLSWGRNQFGQVGNNNPSILGERYPATVLFNGQALSGIKAIDAGELHSIALSVDGRVYCWGDNSFGQIGDGNQAPNYNSAYLLSSPTNVDGVSTGAVHSLAFSGSTAYAWGDNVTNQLGLAQGGSPQFTAQTVSMPGGISDIYDIKGGHYHSIAITKDSKIYGWGDGLYGQLNINAVTYFSGNTPAYSTPPYEISTLNNSHPNLSPLVPCDYNLNYCYYNYTLAGLSSSVTWTTNPTVNPLPACYLSGHFLIENELFIPKGKSLTIAGGVTLMFGPNGRIVLEEGDGTSAGGVLTLKSGAILTAAEDCMWKGIEVRGNSAYAATNSRQAKLNIEAGAIIEHAHNAVLLGKWDPNYYACYESYPITYNSGFDLSGSGGQIECDNATFRNNATDIRFAPYNKLSVSKIENSDFMGGELRDDRYLSGSSNNPFYAAPNNLQRASIGIKQLGTKIVDINSNAFNNYETAILAEDSRLNIDGNSIEDCRIGIDSRTTISGLSFGGNITGNSFTDVWRQINAKGGRHINIANGNEFNPGPSSGTQTENYFGIYLNNERAFTILDNDFTQLRYGVVSINSNNSGGIIGYLAKGNSFINCWRSVHLQGQHPNLKIKCSTHDNDAGGSLYNTNWNLISGVNLANQGWPHLTSESSQAGNRFLQWPNRNNLTSASVLPFTYFRHGNDPLNTSDIFRYVIPNPTSAIIVNDASADLTDFENACTPVVIPTNGEPDRLAYFNAILDSLSLEIDTIIDALDNGITDSLLNLIDDIYPEDTIISHLLNNGPLSDSVLIKAIENPDALGDSALYIILFTNSPYSLQVLDVLNNRYPEMSEEWRTEIDEVQSLNPPYITVTGVTKEWNYYNMDKTLLINSYVTRLSSADSISKAIQVLETEGGYEDMQTVFGAYIMMGEIDSAEVKLETLANLPGAESDWMELSEILLDLSSESKSWFYMSSEQEELIREIAEQEGNSLAKIQAQNVLHQVFRDTFPDYVDEEEYFLRNSLFPQSLSNVSVGEKDFQIIPNPANNEMEISLSAKLGYLIQIIDITGRVVFSESIAYNSETKKINVSDFDSGIYFVKVTFVNNHSFSKKLIIAR